MALRTGDSQGADAATADVRQGRGQTGEHGLCLARDHIGGGRGDAAVGNVHHEGPGHRLEQLGRQMGQRTCARRAVRNFAGVFLDVIDERFDVFGRNIGVDHQHIGRAANHADGAEVLDRVVAEFAGGGRCAVCGHVALHQGVAIGGGFGGHL